MTATPALLRPLKADILRRWQTAAVVQWKHIAPTLLAPQGAIWKAMEGVLDLLSTAQPEPAPNEQAVVQSADSEEEMTAFAPLHVPLQACAENLTALPVAWPDLRQMLRLLAAQTRAVLSAQAEPPPGLALRLMFYDGALEVLACKVADIKIAQQEQQIASDQEQTLVTQHLAERFLGNASHELRTPLTAVLGFADLLLEETYGELTSKQAEAVGHIENSAQNLDEIISNMLDLLHIRAGKLSLQYRPIDVGNMLQRLYQILLPLAGRKNVHFRMEIPDELGTVEIAENIVRHIVYHLLSSALRATPAGGEVLLIVRRDASSLIFEARDTALHLPPEAVANMLDPFPRLENSPMRGYEGWEVGLPLVRKYVELHRGDLRMESLPEQGTIFYVTLPLTRPH